MALGVQPSPIALKYLEGASDQGWKQICQTKHTKETVTFAILASRGAQALTFIEDPLPISNAQYIAQLATQNRLPMIGEKPAVEAGALMAYGEDRYDLWFRTAFLVDKILKGTQPADLPIEQATKFELIINLKTAKALGLTVPPALIARADEVIQ